MSRSSSFFIGILAIAVCLSAPRAIQAQRGEGGGGRAGRGMFGGGMFGGAPNQIALLGNPAVQKELGLSEDEQKSLGKLVASYQADLRGSMEKLGIDFGALREMPQAEREKKMQEMGQAQAKVTEKYQPQLAEALKPEQAKRLKEIMVQAAGALALRNEDVVKALKLSEQQQKDVAAVLETASQNLRRAFENNQGGQDDFQARMELMRKANEQRDADVLGVLSEEQHKQFDELKGKPFDVAQLRPRGFGGGPPRASTGRTRPPM